MGIVAVCTAGGTIGSTTTSLLMAAMAPAGHATLLTECDPSGGDVAAWAELPVSPGWSSAVAGSDRSWAAIKAHAQALPTGLRVMTSPAREFEARTAISEAARGFGDLLVSIPDVVTVADCGRMAGEPSAWAVKARLTLLLLRQGTAQATVARVDRTREAVESLRPYCRQIGVVLIGASPYPVRAVEQALGLPVFGLLPEDRVGAELVAGAWTVGKRASRSPLARAAGPLMARVLEAMYGRHWNSPLGAAGVGGFAETGGESKADEVGA